MEHPTNLMMITAMFRFAGVPDADRLRTLLEERLCSHDRFRQKVIAARTPLAAPRWELDTAFHIGNHFDVEHSDETLNQEDLLERVGQLMSTPLPREHPLWDMLLLTNVEGGEAALLVRLHHAIADGIALIRVLLQMVDVPPATPQIAPAARRASAGGFGSSLPGEARVPLNPGRILDLAAQAAGALTKLVSKRADPASPLKGNLGERKRAALTRPLPLDGIKTTGKALGATVNDVLITALSTAVARYLRARGRDLKRLRAVVPVDLRDPRAKFELGNKFGLVFLSLPLGDMSVPDRLAVVKRRMDRIKKSPEAVVVFGILNSVGGLPAEFEKRLVELFGSKATAVVTNVPGPGEKLALAGCTVDSLMFWVPQSGRLGLGVSILSYGGSVRVGVAADAGLMPRPEELAEYFEEAVAELEATAMEPAHAT